MTALAAALIAELDEATLDALADRLTTRIAGRVTATPEPWLTVEEAAKHLRCPKSRIYALVSAKRIPHHRDGSRLLFRANELDAWIQSGGAKRP